METGERGGRHVDVVGKLASNEARGEGADHVAHEHIWVDVVLDADRVVEEADDPGLFQVGREASRVEIAEDCATKDDAVGIFDASADVLTKEVENKRTAKINTLFFFFFTVNARRRTSRQTGGGAR